MGWVFKWWIKNLKDFWLKIRTRRKLLNFVNWCSGEVWKNDFWHRKLTFKVKFWYMIFFSLNNRNARGAYFVLLTFFYYIFNSLYFLKCFPIFDSSPLHQFTKFNNFLLAKSISNFVSLPMPNDNLRVITLSKLL